ncbi:UMP kinase [Patescibacteria group bacterium]|nr:UMP kinase [Patescibacteria group bacterium]
MENKNWIIFSLGGSLVFPDEIDVVFLKRFRKFILKWLKRGKKFVIFVGGGKLARNFQKTAKKLKIKNKDILDWLGIYATYLNAFLIKSLFDKLVSEDIIKDPTKKIRKNKKIIVGGGWRPGRSTDYDSVIFAKKNKIKEIINLTNVDYVYDKDPKKFKDAKVFFNISFSDFSKIGKQKWEAGLNFPFDPLATRLAQKEKMRVIVVNGKNFKNLDNLLRGKKFKGTIIF